MPVDDARQRIQVIGDCGLDDASRRWLMSPHGLLAACREAVASADVAFFDALVDSGLLDRLDDESLQAPGPSTSMRALGLVGAGRVADWCHRPRDVLPGPAAWLDAAVIGFAGPDEPRWSPPPGLLDGLEAPATGPTARALRLLAAAHGSSPTPALLPVGDLVHAFLPSPPPPRPEAATRVLFPTSRHHHGELCHLVVVARAGPPGIALDPLVGPFTRADAAFVDAVETAWRANRAPSLGARWSAISDRTGVAVEIIGGRSVGAAAGVALHYLGRSDLPALPPTWAVTGALDDSGALTSLLGEDRSLATYRAKLSAAGDRTVVVPTGDHPDIAGLVESGAVTARLLPAGTVAEITAAARSDAASRAHQRAWNHRRRRRGGRALGLLGPALVLALVAAFHWGAGTGLVAAVVMGTVTCAIGWGVVRLPSARPRPRWRTAAALAVVLVGAGGSGALLRLRPLHTEGPANVRSFELPDGSDPRALVPDGRGNLWFTEPTNHRIGRITRSGVAAEFAVPRLPGSVYADPPLPGSLAAGANGDMWFMADPDIIGKINPLGQFTEWRFDGGVGSNGIAKGPDGNMWVRESVAQVARVTPSGVVTAFPLPEAADFESGFFASPGIAAGPDGNLWFTEPRGRIGRVTPAGVVTEFTLPTPENEPGPIVAGPDGNMWFIEVGTFGKIGRVTPTGKITEIALLGSSYPQALTVGSDGAIWFTELGDVAARRISGAGRIGRIDPKHPDDFPLYFPLDDDLGPAGIATGADGNLWFAEREAHRIVTMPPTVPSRLPSVGRDVPQRFLDIYQAFKSSVAPAGDALAVDLDGHDLERIKADYAGVAGAVRGFGTVFNGLSLPPELGEDARSVSRATAALASKVDAATQLASEYELHGDPAQIGLTIQIGDALDRWRVALNTLGTHLGLRRSEKGPVAAAAAPPPAR